MIWGDSSGLAASGLVWAGLAAGERKKVLIVGARALDRGSWQTAYKRLFGPAAAAAREERCCRRPLRCSHQLRRVRKVVKSRS